MRLALAIILTATAGGAAIVTHHTKRPAQAQTPSPASAQSLPLPLNVRASRAENRLPLLLVKAPSKHSRQGVSRPVGSHPRPRRAPASSSGSYADTTMYCSTGSRNAAGRWPRLGDVAVIDRSIPFGTRVIIAGRVYTVADWIGSGSQFDIFGGDDDGCEQRALDYGRRHLRVVVER